MINDKNNFSKRTTRQISKILKAMNLNCQVENLGDNRTFQLNLTPTLAVRIALKKAGFILVVGHENDTNITIKAY